VALQLAPTALGPVVERALDRIRPQAERKNLQVSAQVPDCLPLALIDANRVGQVLLNLLYNAVKFTSDGGGISVRAFTITLGVEAQRDGRSAKKRTAVPRELPDHPSIGIPQPLAPGEWLIVAVADTGIGIPAEDLPRIFERFYKVDRARTRNASGTGLGLAIAKHLIEGHGGSIWATSVEGGGSTFFFALPVA
jgi:two-component system phosphate regulon sensor histidine kinase PhoR